MRKILLFTLMLAMTFSLYSGANAEASSTSTDLLAVKLEKQKDGVRAYQEIVKTLKSSNKSLKRQ